MDGQLASLEQMWALRMRSLRVHRGLSMSEVSQALGVSVDELWAYEAGASRIAASSLWKLCQVLDIAVDELVGRQGSPNLAGAMRRMVH